MSEPTASARGSLGDCPSDESLLAYVASTLAPADMTQIGTHLDTCEICREVLAEAGRAMASGLRSSSDPGAASMVARALPKPGERVGRYLLMEVLGAGAMGVVYSAYDPELDRRVAVKIVRLTGPHDARLGELEARLVAEARMMARLSHPNVVTVHDLGSVDGGIYLAMELVVGQSLRAWLAAAKRPWRAIVDAFVQAGQGLAAAHEAGIIHRDFKPDNVLVDARGQVRVTDFGLARIELQAADTASLTPKDADLRLVSDLQRTRAGTLVGTPAYMAPEQLRGSDVDARADVFAFGVSLYEALYRGARPYPGATISELEQALARGNPAEPPVATDAPRWVHKVLVRALATDRAARFPTMAALVAALRRDPRKTFLKIGLPLLSLTVAAAAVGAVWHLTTADARACRSGASRADAVWSPERRAAAERAFAVSGAPYAADVLTRTSQNLEHHLATWQADRVAACDATHAHGEQSDTMLDLRLRCLDQRLAEADALAQRFTNADATTVERAAEALARLPPSAVCGELDRLRARVPPPADPLAARDVDAAAERRAAAEADVLTGRWPDGIAAAKDALALAQKAGHGPSVAEARVLLAELTASSGDQEAARALYAEALPEAIAAGDDRIAAEAATGLGKQLARLTRKSGDVEPWLGLADAHVARLGGDRRLATEAMLARAETAFLELRAKDALAELERAAALQNESGDDPLAVGVVQQLAAAYQQAEDYPRAIATFARAQALAERTFGPRHPRTIAVATAAASCLASATRYAEAERALTTLLADMAVLYPEPHPDRATALHLKAEALRGLGRYDEAEALHLEAVAIERQVFGQNLGQLALSFAMLAQVQVDAGRDAAADQTLISGRLANAIHLGNHPTVVLVDDLLQGLARLGAGRIPEAEALLRKAEAKARADNPGSTELAMTLDGLGRLETLAGRPAAAVALHREALSIFEARYGEDSLAVTPTLAVRGEAELATGQDEDARATLTRAVALLERQPSNPLELAEVRFLLARALAKSEPERARALGDAALAFALSSPYPRAARLVRRIETSAQPTR